MTVEKSMYKVKIRHIENFVSQNVKLPEEFTQQNNVTQKYPKFYL